MPSRSASVWYARGTGWGTLKDQPLTRFAIYDQMQRVSSTKTWNSKQCCSAYYQQRQLQDLGRLATTTPMAASPAGAAAWKCAALPLQRQRHAATTSALRRPCSCRCSRPTRRPTRRTARRRPANNNWLTDVSSSSSALTRQQYMPKYFDPGTDVGSAYGMDEGPNSSCSTAAIKPLTDVTTVGRQAGGQGRDRRHGVRTAPPTCPKAWPGAGASSPAALPSRRVGSDTRKGQRQGRHRADRRRQHLLHADLGDGESYSGTYWQYGGNDLAGNKSIYSSYGYTGTSYNAAIRASYQNTIVGRLASQTIRTRTTPRPSTSSSPRCAPM